MRSEQKTTIQKKSSGKRAKRQYTVNFILKSSLNAEETDKYRAEFNDKIRENEGNIEASLCYESPKNFAYAIDKNAKGYFCECVFSLRPSAIEGLNNFLKKEDKIIRYMITSKENEEVRHVKKKRGIARATQPPPYEKASETDTRPSQKTETKAEEEKSKKNKVNMEDIEKKLDEIIDNI